MSPEHTEVALVLLGKARGDARAVNGMHDETTFEDEVVGFHAQQAVEKATKAVLTFNEVDFPRTHSIKELVEIADAATVEVPDVVREASWLSEWAVKTRYDEQPHELDRAAVAEIAMAAVEWAASVVEA